MIHIDRVNDKAGDTGERETSDNYEMKSRTLLRCGGFCIHLGVIKALISVYLPLFNITGLLFGAEKGANQQDKNENIVSNTPPIDTAQPLKDC